MKKSFIGVLACILLSGMLMVSSAHAYLIGFDATGASNYDQMNLWVLESVEEELGDTGLYSYIWTIQDKTTGDFTEDFKMDIIKGKNEESDQDEIYDFGAEDLWLDVSLQGNFQGPNILDTDPTVTFTGGDVDFYDDDYDTSNKIGSAIFKSALPTTLLDGVIGETDTNMSIQLTFAFNDDLDSDYFGPTADELAGKEWLLAFVGGQIVNQGLYDGDDYGYEGNWLVPWTVSGDTLDANFNAVPEPASLVLLGSALLGVAALGRRRFIKKD